MSYKNLFNNNLLKLGYCVYTAYLFHLKPIFAAGLPNSSSSHILSSC